MWKKRRIMHGSLMSLIQIRIIKTIKVCILTNPVIEYKYKN